MTALAIRYAHAAPSLNLPRIVAWSATITIHVVALALLLSAPVAYKLVVAPPSTDSAPATRSSSHWRRQSCAPARAQ